MQNTGRLSSFMTPSARRILFGETANTAIENDLEHACYVDRAHLVMLAERGIVDAAHAVQLLQGIDELEASDFSALRGKPAPRGLYLLYESYLMERLGAHIGGVLQTARSRNDLNATVLMLRLRRPYRELVRQSLRLQAVLLRRARQYSAVTMPAYTHYQAALPVSYGHYLAGIAAALDRDIAALFEAGACLKRCSLGAGAVGGTSLPIDPVRTASLLGFDESPLNSIDAVASRDVVIRLLSAATVMGVTLSRLANDFLLWTTSEFGFILLPDDLVGSSSMMPQKRNPFVLEHVLGRSAAPLGGFVAAATAMHGTPFSNSIAVGTEAVSHIWKNLQSIIEAVTLARLVIDGAAPQAEEMIRRATEGFTCATELANRLMKEGGVAFRAAHHTVGAIVRDAIERGESLDHAAGPQLEAAGYSVSLAGLDPAAVAAASPFGGGPAVESINASVAVLKKRWQGYCDRIRVDEKKWQTARANLSEAISNLAAAREARN